MRGFTLIELLAVIVILAIILLIAVPLINNIIEGVKKSAFESSVKSIVKAGEYTLASSLFSPNKELVYTFTNKEISGNFPEAKLEFLGDVPESGNLIIREDGKISTSLYNGVYCATKDYNETKVTIVDKPKEECYSEISLPEITLNGITPVNIEIHTNYTDLGVVAKTIAGEDITEIETKILKNDLEVSSIDVTSLGTYKIIYTINEGSKTNYVERVVNIVDTIKPQITYEALTNLIINEVDTFDLLAGVNVSDNSLEAISINTTGNIARIAGSYEIRYSATDASGNIEEVVRTINVIDNIAPDITQISLFITGIANKSFVINRSGEASDDSALHTNPYIYEISTDNNNWTEKCRSTESTCTVTGLTENTDYFYRLCAVDIYNNKSCSNSSTTKTVILYYYDKYNVLTTYVEGVSDSSYDYLTTEELTLISCYNAYSFNVNTGPRLTLSAGSSRNNNLPLGAYCQKDSLIYQITSKPAFWVWTYSPGVELYRYNAKVYTSTRTNNKNQLLESNLVLGTNFPTNGIHTDGFWYVRKAKLN